MILLIEKIFQLIWMVINTQNILIGEVHGELLMILLTRIKHCKFIIKYDRRYILCLIYIKISRCNPPNSPGKVVGPNVKKFYRFNSLLY